MEAKKLKIRKPHKCSQCDEIIPIGTMCMYFTGKGARFDSEDNQIGIFFWHEWLHLPEVNCNGGIII